MLAPPLSRRLRPAALALAALVVLACERPPNLLLVSIDTLRPDALGVQGEARPSSPHLDRFASEGALFEDVTSTAPWTLPAHVSMLTGLYPSHHGVQNHEHRLGPTAPTLAEILGARGYATAAVVNSLNFQRPHGLERGFSHYVYVDEEASRRAPSDVEARALEWLRDSPPRPFLLFLHYYDVHSDYRSEPRWEAPFVRPSSSRVDGSTNQLVAFRAGALHLHQARDGPALRDRYLAGVRQMDEGIGRLLAALAEAGRGGDTVVMITSDHGEEFLEHGGVLHGRTLFEEVLQVPWLVRGPGVVPGLRVSAPVSLVDLVPTALGLLDVPAPEGLDGIDLSPVLGGQGPAPPDERVVFAESGRHSAEMAARRGRFKLVRDPDADSTRLYDLERDPAEERDRSAEQPEVVVDLGAEIERLRSGGRGAQTAPALSAEERERLRAIGYLD